MIDSLGQGFRGDYSILQPLLQRVGKAVRIRHQLVKGVAALSGHRLDRLNKARFIGNSLIQQLLPAGTQASAEQFVSRLGGLADHAANGVGNLSQQLFGFFKVADQDLPRRGPSGLSALLQGIPKLGKGFYLRGGVLCRLRHLGDFLCLGLRKALLNQIRLGICAGKLLQGLREDFCGEPLSSGKGFPEGTIHVDGILRSGAQQFGCADQGVLEHLAAHACVDHRVPVHQRHFACGQRLGELIHGRGRLLGGGAGNGGQVRDTLDGIDRCLKIYTSRGKRADVPGHFREVVDRLVRVGVQLIQRPVHLLKIGPFVLGVRQDGLYRSDLGLILLKTGFDGVDREGGHKPFSRVQGRICNVGKGRHGNDFKRRELRPNRLDGAAKGGHIALLSSVAQVFKPLGSTVQIQTLLEFVECRQTGLHIPLKLSVVKSHLDDSLVDGPAHDRVTSFHA